MNNSLQVVTGSMLDEANKSGTALSNTWMNCELLVLCDGSISMSVRDGMSDTRFERLTNEVRRIQGDHPGKIAIASFSDWCEWNPDGNPQLLGGMTDMVAALEFAKRVDGAGITIVLISDGEPDSESLTLKLAETFQTKIDTIFIGSEIHPQGRSFLQKLSNATGGTHQDDFDVQELGEKVTFLLTSGK